MRGLALAQTPRGWEAALEEFLESRRLYPTRSATRNAAIASATLGRYTDALELYDSLLHDFADAIPASQQRTFEAERSELLEHFGQLIVRPSEAGVSIVVDGRERGVSPLNEPLLLQVGTHVVHLNKQGFQEADRQIFVNAASHGTLELLVQPLVGAHVLEVREDRGEALDVVVDAATVGKTPWRGIVSAGMHSVLLRGRGRGTPPVEVDLGSKPSIALSLRATVLDAELAVEPMPPGSTVYLDGAFAGTSRWQGSLPSGAHRVDVIAPGRLPFRRDFWLAHGQHMVVQAALTANTAPGPRLTGFYLEPSAGFLLARTLRGSPDDSCDCSSRSRPFGWLTALRAGYVLSRHWSPEVGIGFLEIRERATRTVRAGSEPGTSGFEAHDERDSVEVSAPVASVGASARFLTRTPVTARVAAGVALFDVSLANSGIFSGLVADQPTRVAVPASGRLSIDEPSANAVVPFVATELRAGYRFTSRLSVDLGLSTLLFLPPKLPRVRRAGLVDGPDHLRVGVLTLPDEPAMRTFVAWSPSVAVRIDL